MNDKDSIKKNISKNLVMYRNAAGLSQKEFANKLGVGPSRVSNWESGTNSMDINMLLQICDLLNVSINDMYGIYPDAKIMLSYSEQMHIDKYRSLDPAAQSHVDSVLDREVEHSAQVKEAQERIAELESQTATIIELQPHTDPRVRLTDYYYSASAGGGIFILGNEASEQIAIPATPENELVDYVIKVSGDSMEPDHHDGDNVMVSQRLEMKHGDVGIFVVNGKAYIKEYGETELISRNPASPNIKIAEYDNIVCMGKVVGRLEGPYEIIRDR